MRAKIKTARKKASKLHGATAQFVSLVDAGANETPFTIIKSKDGAKAMTIKKRGTAGKKTTQSKSHKPLTTGQKKSEGSKETRSETMIAKMVFDASVFETEAEVKSYIVEAEWDAEGIVITKNDEDDWEARVEGVSDEDFIKLDKVATDEEGVEAYVGMREVEIEAKASDDEDDEEADDSDGDTEVTQKADDEDEEDDDEDEEEVEASMDGKKKPAKKAEENLTKRQRFLKDRREAVAKAETVKKFDAWDARFSKGNTLAETIKAGMQYDGTPPGFHEVQAAFSGAVANIVGGDDMPAENKQDALNKAAMEFAEIIGGLDSFFDDFLNAEEEIVAKAFPEEETREAIAKWAEGFGDFASGQLVETKAVAKVKKAAETPVTGTAAIDYNAIGTALADSVAKSLEPIIKQVEDVSEAVTAIATRAPTKKAADPDDSGNAGPRKVKTKAEGDQPTAVERFAKSFLG